MALGLVLGLAVLGSARAGPAEKDLKPHLAALANVGPEGAGNVEAARAWKALVGQGVEALIPLLEAMDDENPRANNWFRSAVNAVVGRVLSEGRELPRERLERFVAELGNPAVGRRLAYEILVQVDPKTPQRLLPRMLADPSPELRRDAVALALDRAKEVHDSGDRLAATAAYRKALAGACDQDQVDAAAKALKGLGVHVDLQAHFGIVRKWHLLAPFDNHNEAGYSRAYPPEKGVDLSKTFVGKGGVEAKWLPRMTSDPYGVLDLNKELGKQKGVVAYAYAEIDANEARPVTIRLGCVTAVKVFLNGKQIFDRDEYHHGIRLDQYTARGTLKAGRNELLLKICQNEQEEAWAQAWAFQVRLSDRVGAAIPFSQPGLPVVPPEVKR
jgi:hypothetical protein